MEGTTGTEAALPSQDRKGWLLAVEDKENIDPASGLTVATRRSRRRTVLLQAQAGPLLDLVSTEAAATKTPRHPLKDITCDFPEAVVGHVKPCVATLSVNHLNSMNSLRSEQQAHMPFLYCRFFNSCRASRCMLMMQASSQQRYGIAKASTCPFWP